MGTEENLEKPGRQTKILVVDDDVRLRDLLRRYLAEHGFAVTTAENAQGMNRFWMQRTFRFAGTGPDVAGRRRFVHLSPLAWRRRQDSDYHADRQGGRYGQDCRTRDGGG